MADFVESGEGLAEDMALIGHQLRDLAAHVESLEAQINAHQSELAALRRELETQREQYAASQSASPAIAVQAAPAAAPMATRVPITPAMANVLKLIHSGQAEEAKRALSAIPAGERNANPAVLALAAAALCIARDDFANALSALGKARQLTDDPRLLRIVELTEAQVPRA